MNTLKTMTAAAVLVTLVAAPAIAHPFDDAVRTCAAQVKRKHPDLMVQFDPRDDNHDSFDLFGPTASETYLFMGCMDALGQAVTLPRMDGLGQRLTLPLPPELAGGISFTRRQCPWASTAPCTEATRR
jgi:hypothetical protein